MDVLRLGVFVLVLAACGSKPTVKTPPGGGTATANGTHRPPAGTTQPGGTVAAAPDVGCLAPSCVYHPGSGAYFSCLAGGAGACFHFGAPCAPKDGCMYDSHDQTYKACASIVEGTCAQWGAACAPSSRCMFSAADGLHHTCEEVAGGTCKRYGALCAP